MDASDARIRAAITQIAADWYAAHRAGPLPEAQRTAFLAWLKASPLHVEEYLGLAALDRTLGAVTDDPSMSIDAWVSLARDDHGDVVVGLSLVGEPPPSRARPVRRLRAFGLAAAGAGIVGLGVLWMGFGGVDRTDARTYRAGHGEQGAWTLPDGSTLHVNTDTAVTVRYTAAERLLELDHGQVALKVAHDDHRAFRVRAGTTDAVAVGTEFDVYRRPDSTSITVVNGQVAVSVDRAGAHGGRPDAGSDGLRVGAGQQVEVVGSVLPAAARPVDLSEAMAWLQRKIIFDRQPLGAVADDFNRYNHVQFTIDDPALRRMTISGTFDANDTDSFAAFLGSLDGVRVERQANRYQVSNARGRSRSPPTRT